MLGDHLYAMTKTPRPQTHNGDITKLPPALAHLRDKKIWVCWKWLWDGKRWTKPPYRADDPKRYASTSDPETWGSYEEAVEQVRAGNADGIGFVLKGLDIGGIDLDSCRDIDTGEIALWVKDYLSEFSDAYIEATVSGEGLRILGTSTLQDFSPRFKGNGHNVELFSNSCHYLTLSCNQIADCNKLPPIGDRMSGIAAGLSKPKQGKPNFDTAAGNNTNNDSADNSTDKNDTWSFAEETRLRSALSAIPVSEKALKEKFGHAHTIWVNIGRAIERLDWGDRGFAIFRDWSMQNKAEFNEAGLRTQWRSFNCTRNTRGRRITIASVFRYAMKCGWSCDQPAEQYDDQTADVDGVTTTVVANLEMSAVDWLWPGRFARGKFGLIAGLPDYGKGQIAAFIAAAITANVELPCNEGHMPPGNVIWFNAEDGAADTIKPRLTAAGADVNRIHLVNSTRVGGKDRMFNLVTDLDLLRKTIKRIGNVVAIIIDPVSAYIGVGKVDGRSATDVRGMLTPLKDLAEELHIAVIGIAHFNKKDDVKSALLRVSDSLAWVAAARSVYAVLDDPENKECKLFIKAKNNLARDTKALRYGIGVKILGRDNKLGVDIDAPFIVWHSQYVDISANEAMAAGGSHTAKREAKEFLLERLKAGPVKADEIFEEAKQEDIAVKTLKRAKKDLGVISRKNGFDGAWMWELPSKK